MLIVVWYSSLPLLEERFVCVCLSVEMESHPFGTCSSPLFSEAAWAGIEQQLLGRSRLHVILAGIDGRLEAQAETAAERRCPVSSLSLCAPHLRR